MSGNLFPALPLASAIHDNYLGAIVEHPFTDHIDSLLPEGIAVSGYGEIVCSQSR